MTVLVITAISILVLTGLAWLAGKALRFPLCPICIGVAGTWVWMLAARFAGHAIDVAMLAILVGGSVAGIACQLEKRLPAGRSPLLWKTLFFPIGFTAAYGIVAAQWVPMVMAVGALALVSAVFFLPRRHLGANDAAVRKIEEQMKKCC